MTHSDLSQTFHFDLQPENQPRGKSHSIFTRNDVGSEYVPSYTNHTNFARNISSPIYFLYLYTFCGGNWKIKKEHLVWHNRIIFVSKSNDFSTFDESRAAEKNMDTNKKHPELVDIFYDMLSFSIILTLSSGHNTI